jgi:hypothetical protein
MWQLRFDFIYPIALISDLECIDRQVLSFEKVGEGKGLAWKASGASQKRFPAWLIVRGHGSNFGWFCDATSGIHRWRDDYFAGHLVYEFG